MPEQLYICRHDNKLDSYSFGYGYTPIEALTDAFEKTGNKLPNIYEEEITGMTVAKNRFFGKPVRAHEASPEVQKDVEAIRENCPREEWDHELDKVMSRVVFLNDSKELCYEYELQSMNRDEENNKIECAEPIRRDTSESARYRVDESSAIPGKTANQTDKAIEMPVESNVKIKETLEPPEIQNLVNKYSDKVSVATMDTFIRCIKGERINETTLSDEGERIVRENSPNFKAFMMELQQLVDKNLPKYQDGNTLIDNLRKNFPLQPSPELEDESETGQKQGTPFAARVTTSVASICANYEMNNQSNGALLLCNKRDNSPEIKADHKLIRTLKQNERTIQDTVALAKERNWSAIKVSGLSRYKSAIWLEASLQQPPIAVIGYKPNEQDQQALASFLEQQNQDYITGKEVKPESPETPPLTKNETKAKGTDEPVIEI